MWIWFRLRSADAPEASLRAGMIRTGLVCKPAAAQYCHGWPGEPACCCRLRAKSMSAVGTAEHRRVPRPVLNGSPVPSSDGPLPAVRQPLCATPAVRHPVAAIEGGASAAVLFRRIAGDQPLLPGSGGSPTVPTEGESPVHHERNRRAVLLTSSAAAAWNCGGRVVMRGNCRECQRNVRELIESG